MSHPKHRQMKLELMESRQVLSAVPIGPQFLVNETLSLEESAPAVAVVESSGDMVVAWTSYEEPGGDTSGLGVYVQQFHDDGTPQGAAMLVNTSQTAGDQFAPDVAVNAAGEFVVVWQGQDADGFGVFGQRYAADGSTIGSEFSVNTYTPGDQSHPKVAMDNAGNFVVTWESDGQDGDGLGIFARRYDSAGNALEAEEFQVNSAGDGIQAAPTVAMARENGNFVIAWEGEVVAEHSSFEIFAHIYDIDANTIHGEFQVNATAAREQVDADIAMDPDGDIVVTWKTEGIPGSGSDIFARQFDAAGNEVAGEFQVNVAALQGQVNPGVTMNANGDYFITWQSSNQDGASWAIVGRAFEANGDPMTTDVLVNTFADGPQTSPVVASNSDGQTVALWLGATADHASAVHAQRYQLSPASFSTVGDELVLANYLGLEDTWASAAVSAKREFFVVWQSYGEDGDGLSIMGRRIDSVGNPLGDAFVVNSTATGNQINPAVAMDASGRAVVVWESADQDGSGHGIYGQRYNALGNPVGPEFLINTTTLGSQINPSVAMNWSTGDFTVVWQGPDADGDGIYGQRFDATGAMVGTEFQVNQLTNLAQVSPRVSMNAAGQFAVVWVSDHRAATDPDDSEKSIFVQWYDADGTFTGDEELVHTIDKDFEAQEYPDVALDDDGNMMIVWQSILQDGSAWGVFGRQFLADKTPVQASEFQINQNTGENQRYARVAADSQGNFTVTWQSDLQDQSATAVISRQYHSDGTPETDEMVVNTWTLGPQIRPVVAMTQAGDFGIFWDGQGNARAEGIHGRIFEEGFVPPEPHIEVTPIGDQFTVNEAYGIPQSPPAVSVVEADGSYVAAWTSFEQGGGDESGLGVYAQVFAADGTPLTDPILVNVAFTADDQSQPAVATDENGNFVVVWQSLNQDGSGWGIYAQRFQADGTLIGSEFQVNTIVNGDQTQPTIAMDNAGNFVIAWEGADAEGTGIFARRYGADGLPLETEEFLVNPTEAGNQTVPTIARARDDGRFLIAWQSEVIDSEGEIGIDVVASLYDASGGLLNEEFLVNSITDHDQVGPHAAMAPLGEFVVSWTTEGQVASGADIYARQFGADGTALGDDFLVNETAQRGQEFPTVGIDADRNFMISWQSSHQDGFSWGIFGKVYDWSGAVLQNEFQVNTNVQGPQILPAMSANSDGTAIVTWLGLDTTHQPAVHAQRYQLPQGLLEFEVGAEGEVILNNYVGLEEAPAATAVDAAGNFVVTWQSYGEDGSGLGIFARRFDATGTPLGDAFQVNLTSIGSQSEPTVASDDAGNFTIAWQAIDQDGDGYGIFARRYDSAGNPIGGEFQVNTTTLGHQTKPDIAMDADDGSFMIVWQGPDVDGLGIFAQRFDAAGVAVGGEFQVNQYTDLDQFSPTISMNANGETVVAWVSDHRAIIDPTDTEKSIFVQWYDTAGNSSGEEVLVHSLNPAFEAQELPDVAIDADGNFVMVWQSINQDGNTWGVFGRQFLADKTPVQAIEFQVNQTVMAPQRHASVVSDAEGNFVVAWQGHAQDSSGPGVFARAYDACAIPQTDEFLIPSADQGPQTSPVMALASNGKLGMFWTGHGIDRLEGVHGRIYDLTVGPLPPWVIQGTAGDDVFVVDMSGDTFVVTVNGVVRSLNSCQASALIIHGLAGNDEIRVMGGDLDERAILQVGKIRIYNALLDLNADSMESILVTAGGGDDRAYFHDSPGNDIFRSRPSFSTMLGDGFFNRVDGYDRTVGYAIHGNLGGDGDQAFMQDSAGNDTFRSRPTFSTMLGAGYFNRVEGFGRVVAYAVNGDDGGDGDQAFMQDSAGNDIFYGTPTFSYLRGDGFYNRVVGFDWVGASAANGNSGGVGDQALLFDSPEDDLFYGRSGFGSLIGDGFVNRADGFDSVYADGNAGGTDTLDIDALDFLLTHDGWEIIL